MKTEIEIRRAKNAYEKRYRDAVGSGDEHNQYITFSVLRAIEWILDLPTDNYVDSIISDYIRSSNNAE